MRPFLLDYAYFEKNVCSLQDGPCCSDEGNEGLELPKFDARSNRQKRGNPLKEAENHVLSFDDSVQELDWIQDAVVEIKEGLSIRFTEMVIVSHRYDEELIRGSSYPPEIVKREGFPSGNFAYT